MPRYLHVAVAMIASLMVLGTQVHAATLDVVGGSLIGASDVNVNGTLYNVTFVDGSCNSLFTGCDTPGIDFAFQTLADAQAAAAALLSQVFIDDTAGSGFDFDVNPNLTNGCTSSSTCTAFIPFAVDGGNANLAESNNRDVELGDGVSSQLISRTYNSGTDVFNEGRTYANFSPVPLPAAVWLFGSALGLLGWMKRRA
ncbi:MAG: VPLPA-CTERM sorting domain-containing protein [Pseudomonadales bacterium]